MPPSKSESPGRKSDSHAENSSASAKQSSAFSGDAKRKHVGHKCEPSSFGAKGKQTPRDDKETAEYVKFLRFKFSKVLSQFHLCMAQHLCYRDRHSNGWQFTKSVLYFINRLSSLVT